MNKGFGFKPGNRGLPLDAMSIAGLVMLVATTGVLAYLAQRRANIIQVRSATIVGPPCPIISRQAYLSMVRKPYPVDFDGAWFTRADGYVSCGEIKNRNGLGPDTIPICRFSDPTVLDINTPRGDFIFATEGRAATVTVDGGRPNCVLGAKLAFDWNLLP